MASSIVSSVGKQLGTLLVQEAKNLYEVSDKIKNLQSELVWMQCFLEDADNKEHKEKVVALWVAEIRDFAYEAEDLIERYLHEVSHHRLNGMLNTIRWFLCICSDVVALHRVGSSMEELSNKINQMRSRLQMYGIHSKQPESSTYDLALREQRRTYSHTKENTVGLKNHIEVVVDKLVRQNEANIVGISGIGGLGKTTLAREVYLDKQVKEHFKNSVWVYISKQFERRSVFEEILKGLGRSGKDLTDAELPQKICKVLEEEESLVLLDDIWTKDAWDTLKPAFESIKRSRSKILITTRNMELAQYADPSGYTLPFGILSDEDSWKLLKQTINMEENTAAEVKTKMDELGKAMLKHCGGLPLAIVALGGILATKNTIHEWEVVSKNMNSYLSDITREDGGDRVSSVLELSYDDLPFYLKPCFMYLGCFPEDYEISTDRLYQLWEAEGLVTMPMENNGVRLDDIAESYLNQLVNRSMVQVEKRWQNGSIDTCRLHDVMRDMCLNKCRELNFLKITEVGNRKELSNYNTVCSSLMNTKIRRTIIHLKGGKHGARNWNVFNVVDPNEAPYIRSLLAFADGEVSIDSGHSQSQKLRKGFSLLRALDLEWLSGTDGVDVVRYSIHLRYLRLWGSGLLIGGMIDYISACKYLETLDLQCMGKCHMSNELWKLERLRHLYLPVFFRIKDSSKLRLTRIQLGQLETFMNFDIERCQIEDLEKMTNLRIFSFVGDRFKKINKDALLHLFKSPAITNGRLKSPLDLKIGTCLLKEHPTILSSPSLNLIFIRYLEILGTGELTAGAANHKLGERANNDLKIFPRNVMDLQLEDCSIRKEDILELEKLPWLENLEIYRGDIEGGKMSFSFGGFKKLLTLTLLCIDNLEEWEVGEGALPNLLSLTVYCDMLKRIPEGLPASMKLRCSEHINGSEMYKQVQAGLCTIEHKYCFNVSIDLNYRLLISRFK